MYMVEQMLLEPEMDDKGSSRIDQVNGVVIEAIVNEAEKPWAEQSEPSEVAMAALHAKHLDLTLEQALAGIGSDVELDEAIAYLIEQKRLRTKGIDNTTSVTPVENI